MKRILFFSALLLICSQHIFGDTWTVTNKNAFTESEGVGNMDTREGDLKFCMQKCAGGDDIVFDASLNGQTIYFSINRFLITKAIVLDASELPNGIILDGGQSVAIFKVNKDVSETSFYNITFKNGKNTSGVKAEGGAITVAAPYVYFENCKFIDNSSVYGVVENGAWAGALHINNPLSFVWFKGCVFKNNYSDKQGGAILVAGATNVLIEDCLFDGNKADFKGGAIMVNTGTGNDDPIVEIINSTFINNVLTGIYGASGGNGIAIGNDYTGGHTIKLINTTVTNNIATEKDRAAVSTSGSDIIVGSSLIAGNLSGDTIAWDISVTKPTLQSLGYNVFCQAKMNGEELIYSYKNDVQYLEWAEKPILPKTVNENGVVVPITTTDAWKAIKVVPLSVVSSADFLGTEPKDCLGNIKDSRLTCAGSYELPAYVLEMKDASGSVTPADGINLYLKGTEVQISSAGVDKWTLDGVDNGTANFSLTMNKDYVVEAFGASSDRTINGKKINVYNGENKLIIENAKDLKIELFSAHGVKMGNYDLMSDYETLSLPQLNNSIIIIRISDKKGSSFSDKIIL